MVKPAPMAHPKSEAGIRLGIVNPLTLVGNEITTILRERSFPYAKLALLDSTGEAGGALTDVGDEPAYVVPVAQEGLDDLDLVFFCGPAEANREWIARYAEDDFIAVDLSQPTTAEKGRIVVAGVNLDELDAGESLLVSPHPVAVPLALILAQIATVSPVESCVASVIQPASEYDQGVDELAQQTISVLNIQSVPKNVFNRQVAFNAFPAAEQREPFIVSQVQAITNARTQIALFLTQGTVFHGHALSLFIRTREPLDAAAVGRALAASPAIALQEGDQDLGLIDAAGKDEVLIAEVRQDPGIANGFWVWAVCDNLRRGAALNAVLVAEKALFATGATN